MNWLQPGVKVRLKRAWMLYEVGDEAYVLEAPNSNGVLTIGPEPGSHDFTFINASLLEAA